MNLASIPSIDFYVSVVDNYGDMGFAVNLALSFHERYPSMGIRFFSDDSVLFRKFFGENIPRWVEYMPLGVLSQPSPPSPSTLICSFFDYPLQKTYLARFAYPKTIVSFSYFLLHKGLGSLHGTTYMLESGYDRVIHFIPSLLPFGGGVIINPEIERRKSEFVGLSKMEARRIFLDSSLREVTGRHDVAISGSESNRDCFTSSAMTQKKWISVFVYPETLGKILPVILSDTSDAVFWICGGAGRIPETRNCRILPFLPLEDYGVFQSLCDANVVRGENSLCQGLISGKPVLWDIYKESNGAHREKTEDFIRWIAPYFGDSADYTEIALDFMNNGSSGSFREFIRKCQDSEEAFGKVSEYARGECDLMEKLEKILEI